MGSTLQSVNNGEIMKNECKCNGNCQCGNHPCLEEDANCICKERGQSYPKIYCNGTSSNVPRKSKTVEGKTIGRPSQLDAMIKVCTRH